MRFSILGLLAVTFLAALLVTQLMKNQQNRLMRTQFIESRAEIKSLETKASYSADPKKLVELCAPGIEEMQFPSPLYQQVEANFNRLREKYGQLTIKNPALIAIRSVPTFAPFGKSRFECRVFIPESVEAELEIFASEGNKPLPRSMYSFDGTVRVPMAQGESSIRFEWSTDETPPIASVFVGDKLVLEATHQGEGFSGSGVRGLSIHQMELKHRDHFRLLGFHPTAETVTHELNLVLRKVDPNNGTSNE